MAVVAGGQDVQPVAREPRRQRRPDDDLPILAGLADVGLDVEKDKKTKRCLA
jgi:hypothetical protein